MIKWFPVTECERSVFYAITELRWQMIMNSLRNFRYSKSVELLNRIMETYIKFGMSTIFLLRADNEPNQLENSSRFDSVNNSLNLVRESNESNLSWKLSSLNKWVELELWVVRLIWFMKQFDIYICCCLKEILFILFSSKFCTNSHIWNWLFNLNPMASVNINILIYVSKKINILIYIKQLVSILSEQTLTYLVPHRQFCIGYGKRDL